MNRNNTLEGKVRKILVIVIFLLWLLIGILLTNLGPFKTVGNGYFASWVGLFLALKLFSTEFVQVQETLKKVNAMRLNIRILIFSSVQTMLAGLGGCLDNGTHLSLYTILK